MCGIVSVVTADDHGVDWSHIEGMMQAVAHRGPDDFGYASVDPGSGRVDQWREEAPGKDQLHGVVFGHRRLSILDLSSAGHQPFVDPTGNLVLCYNGEIFNYVELRQELEALGATFRTRTDTEVVLAAYKRWGVEAFNRFNGMWAFTLWDNSNQRFLACRDRFGIKPLYYSNVDGHWLFASEMKAILGVPGAHRGIQDEAVLEFIARGAIDHTDRTLFRGISSLLPGEYLVIEGGQMTRSRFWNLEIDPSVADRPSAQVIRDFRDLLSDSVAIRTRSDVQIGTMLSGGLDSTSIAALIDLNRREASATPNGAELGASGDFYETFTACWPDAKNIDEESQVEQLCSVLGLRSEKMYPSADDLAGVLEDVTYALDEPFETPICAVQYGLMAAANARGVKVVLNGHGSDELLAGYPEVFVPPFLAQKFVAGRWGSFAREFQAFGSPRQWSLARLGMDLLRSLTPVSLRSPMIDLLRRRSERGMGIFRERVESTRDVAETEIEQDLTMLAGLQWTAFKRNLIPQWLRMEDRVSMAHSVESRLPFMDYRIVEFAFSLVDGMKLKDGYTKYVLRRAVADMLPGSIAGQKHKQRFATPYPGWFRGPWRELIEGHLLTGNCEVARFLELPVFRMKLRAYLDGNEDAFDSTILWRILQTEIWLRLYSRSRS